MKRITTLLLTLVLVLLLAGCGSAQAAGSDSAAAPMDFGDGYWNTVDSNGSDENYDIVDDAAEPGAMEAENGGAAQTNKPAKRIYTGYMEMQTLDFDAASSGIDALVEELGGYFQQSSTSNGSSGYRHANYTIRVPAEQFETFFQKAGALCHVTYSNTNTDDVSESYYDTEARLETARIKLDRLQELLAKATSMEDIITIESAISETEWDIENLSGTLRHYDALVDYATIDVELSEVYKLSGQDEAVTTFGGRLGQSFVNGLKAVGNALEDFAVWLAYSWFWLLVIAAVIVVIVRIARRKGGGKKFSLKRKKAKTGDTEPKE